jgi:tetratricopeptide (TPR) repeat protein
VQLSTLMGGRVCQTETDGNGGFILTSIARGRYIVRVTVAGLPDVEETIEVGGANAPLDLRVPEPRAPKREMSATVSVRELSIPEKARKAFAKGLKRFADKDMAGSLAEFQRAVAAFPSFYEVYYEMGRAQVALGHSIEATEAFAKSIELSDGKFAAPYFGLGILLCGEKKFDEADTVAKTGLSLEPASIIGQFSVSWAELGLGRLGVAEKMLREVIGRQATFMGSYLLLMQIHLRQKNFAALIDDVDAYLKIDGTSAKSAQLRELRVYALRNMADGENQTAQMATAGTQP